MYIVGIGRIKKEDAMKFLTSKGRSTVKSGDITSEELGWMYKLYKVRLASKIGSLVDTFSSNYSRVPEGLKEKLSPEELGTLVDAFYNCYGDGKASGVSERKVS